MKTKKITSLKEILKDGGVAISANASFAPMYIKERGEVTRNPFDYYNCTQLEAAFHRTVLNESTDNETNEIYARMELWLYKYYAFNDVLDIIDDLLMLDDINGFETSLATLPVIDYISKHADKYQLDGGEYANICYLKEFYIDPKYRGKKLSEFFLSLIPLILIEYLGIEDCMGIVTTTVNPYKEQPSIKILSRCGSNEYSHRENCPDLVKAAVKTLDNLGFEIIDKENMSFAIDLWDLYNTILEREIPDQFCGRYTTDNYGLLKLA